MRFRLFGTPVRVHPGFVLVVSALGAGFALGDEPWLLITWVLVVTVSVLVHEFGHVTALRAFGEEPSVELVWTGGLTSSTLRRPMSPGRSIAVSLAGPAAGLLLGFLVELLLINVDSGWGLFVRRQSWYVNIWWSLLNLLPIVPLDGGHVVETILKAGNRSKTMGLALVGFGIAIGVAAGVGIAFGMNPTLMALLLGAAVLTNLRFVDITDTQKARRRAEDAYEQMTSGDRDAGARTIRELLASDQSDVVGDDVYTVFAWTLARGGNMRELATLDPQRVLPDHRALIGSVVAWYRGSMPEAYSLLTHALAEGRVDPPHALFRYSFTRIGEIDELQSWISQLPRDQQSVARGRLADAMAGIPPTG